MSDPSQPISHTFEAPSYPEALVVTRRKKRRYWPNGLLLLLTVLTTLTVGVQMQENFLRGLPAFTYGDGFLPLFDPTLYWHHPGRLLAGVPFSVALMCILLAHEFGHFFLCEHHHVDATLPYFIPVPFMIGTMGAFIRIKSRIRSRQQLFDIGVAGPIAGFVVAFPLLLLGLHLSGTMAPVTPGQHVLIRYPAIFYFAHWLVSPAGRSVPLGHVALHPIAVAAWVGMFATALNLLPGGQLDGGHIIYAVAPRAHKWVTRTAVLSLAVLSAYWWGWLLWALILGVTGWRHPAVPAWPELGGSRRALAIIPLLLLVLSFIPAPFIPEPFASQGWLR